MLYICWCAGGDEFDGAVNLILYGSASTTETYYKVWHVPAELSQRNEHTLWLKKTVRAMYSCVRVCVLGCPGVWRRYRRRQDGLYKLPTARSMWPCTHRRAYSTRLNLVRPFHSFLIFFFFLIILRIIPGSVLFVLFLYVRKRGLLLFVRFFMCVCFYGVFAYTRVSVCVLLGVRGVCLLECAGVSVRQEGGGPVCCTRCK